MRILALAVLTIGAMLATQKVQAQTYDPKYPVCMHLILWGGSVEDCSYYTIEQCQVSASGRPGQCMMNPYYAGVASSQGRQSRRDRRGY